jgi:hypothetical protein
LLIGELEPHLLDAAGLLSIRFQGIRPIGQLAGRRDSNDSQPQRFSRLQKSPIQI